MVFRVETTEPADQDIEETLAFIAEDSPTAAARWLEEFSEIIYSFREMPSRFPLIQEASEFPQTYRCAHLHSHRIIFRIDEDEKTVYVVRVYHGARRPLEPGDL